LRAVETARLVAAPLGLPIRVDDALGSALDIESLEALLTAAGNPVRPVLVGHDPDFSELRPCWPESTIWPVRKRRPGSNRSDAPPRPRSGILRWLLPPDLLTGRD